MRCPKCNNWLADFQDTCEKCGEVITKEQIIIPSTWPSFGNNAFSTDPITTKEISLFTDESISDNDKNDHKEDIYYIKKWRNVLENKGNKLGFNWAAAICGPNWLLYRKFYLQGIIIYLATFGIAFFELILISQIAKSISQYQLLRYGVSFLTFLIIRIPLGIIANSIYFNKCIQVISYSRTTFTDIGQREAYIKKNGGNNSLAVTLLIVFDFSLAIFFFIYNAIIRS